MERIAHTRVKVSSEEECIKVQEAVFALGYGWGSIRAKTPKNTKSMYLHFGKRGEIYYATNDANDAKRKTITVEELFNLYTDNTQQDYLEPVIT